MSRILITGSLGTLGKPLTYELERRGHKVFGVDLKHTEHSNYMRADISNARQIDKVFEKFAPEYVYNLAAEFGRNNGQAYYEQLWNTNQTGNRNVIESCLRHGTKFILAGSSEAYGESGQDWLKERWLDTFAPEFYNEYALSKWAQERQAFIAAKNDGLKAVVLRFFNAYGEGEFYSPYRSVVCLFCYRLLHGLPITVYRNYHRVFMHVDDWAHTVANVSERFDTLPAQPSNQSGVPVLNVGGTEYRSVEELVEVILKHFPGPDRARAERLITYKDKEIANVTNKRPDISLAAQYLDHNPTIKLEEGVARTIAWMEKTYNIPLETRLAA